MEWLVEIVDEFQGVHITHQPVGEKLGIIVVVSERSLAAHSSMYRCMLTKKTGWEEFVLVKTDMLLT